MTETYICSKNSFTKQIYLNEIITGQSEDYAFGRLKQFNEKLNVSFKQYYVCITGLKKEVYSGVFSIQAQKYMNIYIPLEDYVREYLCKLGYRCEVFMFYYFNTKQMVIFMETCDNVFVAPYEANCYDRRIIF